ncbi:MAG: M20 family peptidase [Gemmatimonadales bacterium]|nr:MAG: M20 family peptidase [Gemmatimonadales bacterium]
MNGSGSLPEEIRALVEGAREWARSARTLMEELAAMESPSGDEAAVREVSERFAGLLEERGARVERHPAPGWGQHLDARLGEGAPPLLVVGHLDTVHPVGTLERLPVEERTGNDGVPRLYGPGVYDMKGGLALLLTALELLESQGRGPGVPLRILVTADEEVGSPHSRDLLETAARDASGALVLEPPLPGGGMKVRRKGMAGWTLAMEGVPAHAGIEPEKGASAIHALVGVLEEVVALGRPAEGTTVNVGTIRGGTTGNVVAESAEARVDVRFRTRAEGARVTSAMEALRPRDPRCTLRLQGGINRGAMEPGPRALEMARRALEAARPLARAMGRPEPHTGATGGGSDGNLISAVGCPVLDGLGPDGAGAHTMEEHVLLEDLPYRIVLYSLLLSAPGLGAGTDHGHVQV